MSTPPPHGQDPYGQDPYGQDPYGRQPVPGQPPQPGTPYLQQPGQAPQNPYASGPGGPPPGPSFGHPGAPVPPGGPIHPGAPMAPTPPKRKIGKRIALALGPLLVLVVLGAIVSFVTRDDTTKLAVGDCLQNQGSANSPEIERLDCSNPEATHKVLEKKNDTSSALTACQNVSGAVATLTWQEGSGSFVLCLANNG